MRNYSFIKVFVAALTIAFAVSMGTVPGSAQVQPRVSTSNVTQMRLSCSDPAIMSCLSYDKIAKDRWVERTRDGHETNFFVEDRHDDNKIWLSRASDNIKLVFDFRQMTMEFTQEWFTRGNQLHAFTMGISEVYEISSDTSPDTCKQETVAGAKCTCDLGSLRPLQGAVGMEEVRNKQQDIVSGEKTRLDLAYDPIKIARGPNGLLYVTDHHHGARAWIEAGHTMGTCQIQSATISTDPTQFWADLKERKLVRLADQNGRTITEAQLPTTLRALPDDPYRSLAWRVRKKNGFCRALMQGKTDFAEFQWADWLRTRITPSPAEGKDWSKSKREAALALAKTPAAAGLPGYRGDKPPDYTCPPDPD